VLSGLIGPALFTRSHYFIHQFILDRRLAFPTSVIAQFDAITARFFAGAEAPHWLRPCRPTAYFA
jgi:hypothetical protein